MNKFIVIVFTLVTLISSLSFAGEISSKESGFIEKISQTIDHLNDNKNLVWKNYNLSDTPIIITFSNKHIYAFGLKSDNPVWQKKIVGNSSILFSDFDHWGLTQITMQDKFLVDGYESFVFTINETEATNGFIDRPILVLVHELFHRYQFANFKKMQNVGEYLDRSNIENLGLINLEERILIDFLRGKKEHKLEALKNYIAVNQTRNKLIHESSVKWERFQQVMEGLADYASVQTFDTFPVISNFKGEKHLQFIIAGYVYSEDSQELAVKWRHYGVGAALGKALDFMEVSDWKEQIEMLGESQASILEKTIHLSDDEIASRLAAVKVNYGYDKIHESINGKVTGFTQMIDDLMSDYQAEDGFVVTIERPQEVGINGGGSSCGIYHLENGLTVSVKDKSVSSSTDNLWKIELKEIPFLFQNGRGARIIKVDHNLEVILDGKTYSIDSLKNNPKINTFKSLSWNCKTSAFESIDREGRIICDDRGLSILFN
jgi:hypothetical protein